MTDKQKRAYALLKSEARDLEELNRIVRAFTLGQETKDGSVGIISAKIDRLYEEILEKKYGK